MAAWWLRLHGWRILARRVKLRMGEIDLVCDDGTSIVFVEVRLRRNADYGGAAASIDARKRARIVSAARHWLATRGARHAERPCRFDAVLLDGLEREVTLHNPRLDAVARALAI